MKTSGVKESARTFLRLWSQSAAAYCLIVGWLTLLATAHRGAVMTVS